MPKRRWPSSSRRSSSRRSWRRKGRRRLPPKGPYPPAPFPLTLGERGTVGARERSSGSFSPPLRLGEGPGVGATFEERGMNQKAVIRPVGRLASPVLVRPSLPSVRALRKLIVPAALLVLWQVLAWQEVYSRSQLPPPLSVFRAGRQLWQADDLLPHIEASLRRVWQGFFWGSLIAIAVGLLVGLFRTVDELVSSTIQAIRAI